MAAVLIKIKPPLRRSVMHRNFGLLLVLFGILAVPVFAAEVVQTLDIPASESSEGEIAPDTDTALESAHKLQKRDNAKTQIQSVDSVDSVDDEKSIESNMLVLQGLNKVLGRVSTLEIPLGTLARFENLEIIARKCWKSAPDERPENASLLEIREVKSGEEPKQIFLGWMLSSSPALSSLEHPVYDVTVLSCEFRKDLEVN